MNDEAVVTLFIGHLPIKSSWGVCQTLRVASDGSEFRPPADALQTRIGSYSACWGWRSFSCDPHAKSFSNPVAGQNQGVDQKDQSAQARIEAELHIVVNGLPQAAAADQP